MAYYAINNFDSVAKHYGDTKPIVSSLHTLEQDIRPIASRRRKWDRIIKISDTQYGLSDGYYSDMYNDQLPKEFVHGMLPILWERRADGDYIRLRTVNSFHTVHTRLKFMSWFLPRGMTVSGRNGKMFIHTTADDKEHYLPKTTYYFDYGSKTLSKDDGMCLWFKHTGEAKFERVNTVVAMSDHVDIQLKKQLKPSIKAFFDWACAIRLMFDYSWESRREYLKQMEEWAVANDPNFRNDHYRGLDTIDKKFLRDAIVQDEHPLKVPLAIQMYNAVGLVEKWSDKPVQLNSEEDVKRVKASYNRWITKVLGLYKEVTY